MYKQTLDAPKSLKYLIVANNNAVKQYQEQLMKQVYESSVEHMQLLNLDPKDGWRFDLDNMQFVQIEINIENAPISE